MEFKERPSVAAENDECKAEALKKYNVAKNTYEMLKKTLSQMNTESKSYDTVLEEVASAKSVADSLWDEVKEMENKEPKKEQCEICKRNMFLVKFPTSFNIDPSLVRSVKYVNGNIDSFEVTFIDTIYDGVPPYELYKKIKRIEGFEVVIDKLEPIVKTLIYEEVHTKCKVDDFKYCAPTPSLDYEDDSWSTFSILFSSYYTYQCDKDE